MANVQMPVLFTISDSTGATLFGENITADLIENHLPFTLDRSGAFHTAGFDAATVQSTLLDAFKNTFYVGDPDGNGDKLFYVNMLTATNTTVEAKKLSGGGNAQGPSDVVDEFCNKLADALLKLHSSKGLVHVPSGTKVIPVGGKSDATQQNFTASVAPTEAEQLNVGQIMARVASVHLVGHPLAQAIFSDEDSITTSLTSPPAQDAAKNPGGIFKTNLARLLSHSLGGSQAANANLRLKAANDFTKLHKFDAHANTAFNDATSTPPGANSIAKVKVLNPGAAGTQQQPFYYNLAGVDAADGTANPALKSLFEQLLNVSGRTQEINDARGAGYTVKANNVAHDGAALIETTNVGKSITLDGVSTKTLTTSIPIKANDTLGMFLRPKLKLKFETTVTGPTNISFVELNTDGTIASINANQNTADITTTSGAASGVATVFPGYAPVAVAATQAVADAYQAGKYGWMGSANAATAPNKKRSLSQNTTDTTDADIMDQHIWKIVVKL